jgi:hypothetical protein
MILTSRLRSSESYLGGHHGWIVCEGGGEGGG